MKRFENENMVVEVMEINKDDSRFKTVESLLLKHRYIGLTKDEADSLIELTKAKSIN